MTTQYDFHGRRRSTAGSLFGVVLALVLGAVVLGVFLHRAQSGWAGELASLIMGRRESFTSSGDVVAKIQKLNRLETVVYSLDTVEEGRESSPLLPDALAGDKLLMIVHGQTIAGIDFGKLKPENVQISDDRTGRSIRLTLPPSEVFLTTIDSAKTRVYARNTGLFVSADPNLETATRAKAQGDLQGAALADGVLQAASKNARETVRAMLEGLGFTKVELQ